MTEEVFILGAGFSKAVDTRMPTLGELSLAIANELGDGWPDEWGEDLRSDVELLLTHLASAHPWEGDQEHHAALADYHQIHSLMTELVGGAEIDTVLDREEDPPGWLCQLVRHWHGTRSTVITFNYDTLVERAARHALRARDEPAPTYSNLYLVPLTRASARYGGGLYGVQFVTTFSLLKLHGSCNWWYSGPEAPPGDAVFVTGWQDPWQVAADRNDAELVIDKVPLVVPPTLQKEPFYSNSTLRAQWEQARIWIENADRVVMMGYSLPPTDLTSRLLLSTARMNGELEVVDIDPTAEARVGKSLPGWAVRQQFSGSDCIAEWVESNTN